MKTKKKKLDIDKCIIIGNAKRVSKDLKTIKNKSALSVEIYKRDKLTFPSPNSVFWKLYRYERDGFYSKEVSFIKLICEILIVEEKELVIDFD